MKRLICALLAGLSLLMLSGCGSVFERDYYYETPYTGDIAPRSDRASEIRNYSMLKTALTNMITNHTEKGEFRFSNYNGSINEDLAAVCFEIKSEHPLGAYAVETLSYDTSYVVSYYVANVYISYKRTAEELTSIVYTSTAADFIDGIYRALEAFEPQLVIRSLVPEMNEDTVRNLVKQRFYDDPVPLVGEPSVEVTRYPADGSNCIYDLRFRYAYDARRSETMAQEIEEAVGEFVGELTETEKPALTLEAAVLLSERCAGGNALGSYADTVYGALVRSGADSRGLALAYKTICNALNIECTVVEGLFGSMGSEPHFWNIIGLDGEHYHVDISAMHSDPAGAFLLSDDALWGRYIWDTEKYPVCDGPLRYAEVAGIPEEEEPEETEQQPETPEETETPQPTDAPEETEPPQEPDPPEETEPPAETEPPQEPDTPQESEPPQPSEPEPTPESPDDGGEAEGESGEKTP